MQKASRLLTTTLLGVFAIAVVGTQGCSSPSTAADGGVTPDSGNGGMDGSTLEDGGSDGGACPGPTCVCEVSTDCCAADATTCNFVCSPAGVCIPICLTNSDCTAPDVCDPQTSQCLPPGCNSDGECNSGQQCVGGTCQTRVAPTSVATCEVQPANAVTHQGDSKTFTVLSLNAAGSVIPYIPASGELTWSVTGDVTLASAATATSASVTGGSTAGAGTVAVSVGTVVCTAANVQNVASVAAPNTLQVTVVDDEQGTPISGATVVVSDTDEDTDTGTTSAGGSWASQVVFDTNVDISVFLTGYSYVSVLQTTNTDIIVFLKKVALPGILGNNMEAPAFSSLQNIQGTVHLAINGPSISGNLIDLSLSTLLGTDVPTSISLGGSSATMVNLPNGIVIGLGDQMFKDGYAVQADTGLHTVWGLGGNVVLSDVLGVISGAVGGGPLDIGSILTALLPVIGDLQSAVTAGQTFTAGVGGAACTTSSDCTGPASVCVNGSSTAGECVVPVTLNFDTLLRINATANIPYMPTYTVGTTASNFSDALVLAGGLYEPQGLVPLGLTAGADQNTGTTMNMIPDGITDPVTIGSTTYPPGQLPMSFAAEHGGVEGSPQTILALAANLSGLGLGGSSSGGATLALSGLVNFPSTPLTYAGGQGATVANTVSFANTAGAISAFMNVETNPTLTVATRTLALSPVPNGTGTMAGPTPDLQRIELESADSSGNPVQWDVYFAPVTTATSIVLPSLPSGATGLTDPLVESATVNLQNVSLKLKAGYNYNSVFTFTGDTTDNLTAETDAFSVVGITPQ